MLLPASSITRVASPCLNIQGIQRPADKPEDPEGSWNKLADLVPQLASAGIEAGVLGCQLLLQSLVLLHTDLNAQVSLFQPYLHAHDEVTSGCACTALEPLMLAADVFVAAM